MDPMTMGLLYGGGSLLSGLGGLIGGNRLAGANYAAGNQSAMLQALAMQQAQGRFSEAQSALQPFIGGGQQGFGLLMKYLQGGANKIGGGGDSLLSTFAPTMAQLEKTPGYQFVRDQNLKAVQNSAAARGLGSSGNALQGGVDYANNMASTTYQQQLQNYLAQNQQAYNMLMGTAGVGLNAANTNMQGVTNFNNSMLGAATGLGNTMGNALLGGASATANGMNSLFGGVGRGLMGAGMMGMQPQQQTNVGMPTNIGAYGQYTSPLGQLTNPASIWGPSGLY